MNSEKVKEIKKAIEWCNIDVDCNGCPYYAKKDCIKTKDNDILTLINELESENERLKIVVDIANEREYRKKFIDEWRKEYQKELDKQGNGHIAGYPDFDLVYKLYFEQKDRIAELEKENEILTKDIVFSNDKIDMFGKPVILTIGGVALGEAYNRIVNWEQEQQRIKELEEYIKGNEQDAKAFVNGWRKDLETELKQFAERLKEKMPIHYPSMIEAIDEP